jgi:hypothetical protein
VSEGQREAAVTHALFAMSVLFVAVLAYLPGEGPPIE